ncbi:MAG: hypothetical protein ABSB50_13940 [Terracidiphilus sp.]|jgi:hypothetical protein
MKRNPNPETDHGAMDSILADEEELIPSSGFLAATMERVRDEAAMPKPIPFPWLRALPGIVLAVAVLCWSGFELVRAVLTAAQERASVQMQLSAATARAMEPAGWVALALFVSMLSWLFAKRLAGRSGLL